MGKKVIRLTEADIEKIVQKVLSEQPLNDNLVLEQLNDRITSFMEEKQTEIFNDNRFIQPVAGQDGLPSVEITDKEGNVVFNKPFDRNTGVATVNRKFDLGTVKLSEYYDEIIGNNNNFKTLISLHPEIKEQMNNMVIPFIMYPYSSDASFKIFEYNKRKRKKRNQRRRELKSSDRFSAFDVRVPLKQFFDNTPMAWGRRNFFYEIEMGSIALNLGSVGILHFGDNGEKVKLSGDTDFAEGKVKLDLVDMFDYDTIDFKDQTKFDNALNKFKTELNSGLKKLTGLKDWLQKQNLIVYGYASQDANPDDKVSGGYDPCKGSGLRKDYNVCLSKARAEKVASELQKVFNEAGVQVTIKHQGNGETTKFKADDGSVGNGWSDGKKDDEKNLSPNRRVIFNIPKYTEVTRN